MNAPAILDLRTVQPMPGEFKPRIRISLAPTRAMQILREKLDEEIARQIEDLHWLRGIYGVREAPAAEPPPEQKPTLTRKQLRVMKLYLAGQKQVQIARSLKMPTASLSQLMDRVREKMGCANNFELIERLRKSPPEGMEK